MFKNRLLLGVPILGLAILLGQWGAQRSFSQGNYACQLGTVTACCTFGNECCEFNYVSVRLCQPFGSGCTLNAACNLSGDVFDQNTCSYQDPSWNCSGTPTGQTCSSAVFCGWYEPCCKAS